MKLSAVASLIGLCVIGGAARADELYSTLSQGVREVAHTVEVRITDGVATYVVRRQFANPGKIADEATLTIQLPPGAAATGLRIKAHDRWYDGDLLASDRAAALYRELTGLGAYDPKDPALLSWAAADQLHLQVFPVMPGQVSTVEYTLTAPTGYAHGRYWIAYPRLMPSASERGGPGWPGEPSAGQLVTPVVTVRPAWPTAGAAIQLEGVPAAAGAAIALTAMRPVQDPFDQASGDVPRGVPVGSGVTTDLADTPLLGDDATTIADPTLAVISVTPPPIGIWAVRFGRVVASAAHAFARLEIDVAPVLTAVPRRAQIVFIVDASYSVGAAQLATELAIIRAYLSHVPDAEVEIIVSRRRATRRFGTFVPVSTALAALADRRGFALGNGSAIDDAARIAATALADRRGPRRV
ncbi:MAG TPA: VIT domain-containing protein, partial [Kofleriaceae bacterium]|nr:VIT domain-containing protein [Kofleriaceae bacterium]